MLLGRKNGKNIIMTNAIRDKNHTPVLLGVLYSDGVTLVPIAIDGNGDMVADEHNTISFTPNPNAIRDENFRYVLMGVDSTDSTKTVPIYVNSSGGVLLTNV